MKLSRLGSSTSTLVIAAIWLGLCLPLVGWALSIGRAEAACFAAAAALLWITGGRACALWWRARAFPARGLPELDAPPLRIALLYCVAGDGDPDAIAASARQDVPVDVVVLDDSTDAGARRALDLAATRHGWTVIRRADRRGYKAGNLNHGLTALRGRYDAYALCDSDVVLPRDFVRRAASALHDPTVAVAQGQPVARRGATWFARFFGPLLETHTSVTRAGRAASDVVTLLGRGALVRAAALEDVGGVPEVVAEDLALTIALRRRGWRLVNVPVSFEEDYPIDYRSFRTQLRKTAEGAVELLRQRGWSRGLGTRERLDLIVETALVPVAALAGLVALLAGAVLAAGEAAPPLWAVAVTSLSALTPLLPETLRRARERRLAAGLVFALVGGALYASTTFVVLAATLRTWAGGRAVFRITPKASVRLGLFGRFALLAPEWVIVSVLVVVLAALTGSPAFALAPVGPLLLAIAFTAVPPRTTAVQAIAPVGASGATPTLERSCLTPSNPSSSALAVPLPQRAGQRRTTSFAASTSRSARPSPIAARPS